MRRQDRCTKAVGPVDAHSTRTLKDDEGPAVVIDWGTSVCGVDAHTLVVGGSPGGGGHGIVVGAALIEHADLEVRRTVHIVRLVTHNGAAGEVGEDVPIEIIALIKRDAPSSAIVLKRAPRLVVVHPRVAVHVDKNASGGAGW